MLIASNSVMLPNLVVQLWPPQCLSFAVTLALEAAIGPDDVSFKISDCP